MKLQATQMKFKQQQQQEQKKHSSHMKVAPKKDKLYFNILQYIYICVYGSHIYASVNWDITISY